MRYLINVAEDLPAGGGLRQTRHFCEIRLESCDAEEVRDIFLTLRASWPIRQVRPGAAFVFSLVGTEEFNVTPPG